MFLQQYTVGFSCSAIKLFNKDLRMTGSDTTKKMEESMKENMISSIKEQAEKQAESMQSQMTDEQKAALAANPELAKKQQDEMQKNIDEQVKKDRKCRYL